MTTNDVKNNRVDLHIHPSCDEKHICIANGSLIVDDGEVLDYEGNHNRYTFNWFKNATIKERPL